MSKEKVDAYKEQKKHRKENNAKDRARKKRNQWIARIVGCLCLVAVVGALGLTGYNVWSASQPEVKDYSVSSQVGSDFSGILEEDDEEAAEVEAEEDTAETEAAETEAE